jgi:hypothetical protein
MPDQSIQPLVATGKEIQAFTNRHIRRPSKAGRPRFRRDIRTERRDFHKDHALQKRIGFYERLARVFYLHTNTASSHVFVFGFVSDPVTY